MKKIKQISKLLFPCALLAPTITCITACNHYDKAADLYKSVINEFYEWCKTPHPTGSLDAAREYLTKKATSLGYTVYNDKLTNPKYTNIWFDVPATKGCENYPKAILQAHMDMRIDGLTPEEAKITPIHPEESVDTKGRKILHSKDYKTSLGADDGIGIAISLAIIQNQNISHGPLRILFTADEENGLNGAENIDPKVFTDIPYLINLDGEGNPENDYLIFSGLLGCLQYVVKTNISVSSPTLTYKYKMKISGLKGGQCNKTFQFNKENGVFVSGNGNKFIFEVLSKLISNYNFEIVSLKDLDDKQEPPKNAALLPSVVEIEFLSNVEHSIIESVINRTLTEWKNIYKNETWTSSGVKCELTDLTSTFEKAMNIETSKWFINHFGSIVPCGCNKPEYWEGDTTEEKIKLNMPAKLNNFNCFSFDANSASTDFAYHIFGSAGTNIFMNELFAANYTHWVEKFGKESVTTKLFVKPWDCKDKPKMFNLALEGFKKLGITPKINKPRSGLAEPALFVTKADHLHQALIGPRIDNIHTKNETLYLDTVENIVKLVIYMVENIAKA